MLVLPLLLYCCFCFVFRSVISDCVFVSTMFSLCVVIVCGVCVVCCVGSRSVCFACCVVVALFVLFVDCVLSWRACSAFVTILLFLFRFPFCYF